MPFILTLLVNLQRIVAKVSPPAHGFVLIVAVHALIIVGLAAFVAVFGHININVRILFESSSLSFLD